MESGCGADGGEATKERTWSRSSRECHEWRTSMSRLLCSTNVSVRVNCLAPCRENYSQRPTTPTVLKVVAPKLGPIARMRILAQENTAVSNMPKHLLERNGLLFHGVPAVVDENVEFRDDLLDLGPECRISLVADGDVDTGTFEFLGFRVDVEAVVAGRRSRDV